jgi:hypothetical protein
MNLDLRHVAVASALSVLLLATISDQERRTPVPELVESGGVPTRSAANATIVDWPAKPRALARMLLEKYGVPDQIVPSQLSWSRQRYWAKIVVFRDPSSLGPSGHLLESVVYGRVSFDRWQDLTLFGRGATYDPAAQELSARTDAEGTNFLALNLADEVIRGRRSAADARRFYDMTRGLSLSGKNSRYMSRLLFRRGGRTLSRPPAERSTMAGHS